VTSSPEPNSDERTRGQPTCGSSRRARVRCGWIKSFVLAVGWVGLCPSGDGYKTAAAIAMARLRMSSPASRVTLTDACHACGS
jgi:hypothetical protein